MFYFFLNKPEDVVFHSSFGRPNAVIIVQFAVFQFNRVFPTRRTMDASFFTDTTKRIYLFKTGPAKARVRFRRRVKGRRRV